MTQSRKVLPRRNKRLSPTDGLRFLEEGPAVGGQGGAEAQVDAQVTEVETARPYHVRVK